MRFREVDVPATHDFAGRVQKCRQIRVIGQNSFPPTGERRDVLGQQAARQQVAENAGVRAGVQERTEASFRVIAKETANFGQSAVHPPAIDRHRYFAIIVAQIAIVRAGSQVHPLSDVGMAEETLVVLVTVTLNDAALDFAADAAIGSKRGAGADVGIVNVRTRTDNTWSL